MEKVPLENAGFLECLAQIKSTAAGFCVLQLMLLMQGECDHLSPGSGSTSDGPLSSPALDFWASSGIQNTCHCAVEYYY